jgi:hypothetical protein
MPSSKSCIEIMQRERSCLTDRWWDGVVACVEDNFDLDGWRSHQRDVLERSGLALEHHKLQCDGRDLLVL